MARRRRRRSVRSSSAQIARRQRRSLMQLGMAVVALVGLLILWGQLAEGAAGCFTTVAGDAADARDEAAADPDVGHDAGEPEPTPNVRVKRVPAWDATP